MRVDGLTLRSPAGWETRARRQPAVRAGVRPSVMLHAMTCPIPADRGDFGSGAVDVLGPDDIFVSLVEMDAAEAGSRLYADRGVPTVSPGEFSPDGTQRPLPGQSGGQWFFSVAGRPFCLFVVLGSHARRAAGAARVNALLAQLDVEAS